MPGDKLSALFFLLAHFLFLDKAFFGQCNRYTTSLVKNLLCLVDVSLKGNNPPLQSRGGISLIFLEEVPCTGFHKKEHLRRIT